MSSDYLRLAAEERLKAESEANQDWRAAHLACAQLFEWLARLDRFQPAGEVAVAGTGAPRAG